MQTGRDSHRGREPTLQAVPFATVMQCCLGRRGRRRGEEAERKGQREAAMGA